MIYITKDTLNYKLEDLPFYNELKLDLSGCISFELDGTPRSLYPMDHKGLHKSIDQIIMTGHYLYGKNRDFRDAYRNANDSREFNINYNKVEIGRVLFFRNLFNLFLYGIVASTYIDDLPESPIHYFARPIMDEKNPSLDQFMNEERSLDKKYRRMDGTPFYNYIMKKSAIMPNNMLDNPITICPIKRSVPEIKQISSNLSELAVYVFKRLLNEGTPEQKNFCKSFIDESWSPYLKAN